MAGGTVRALVARDGNVVAGRPIGRCEFLTDE